MKKVLIVDMGKMGIQPISGEIIENDDKDYISIKVDLEITKQTIVRNISKKDVSEILEEEDFKKMITEMQEKQKRDVEIQKKMNELKNTVKDNGQK